MRAAHKRSKWSQANLPSQDVDPDLYVPQDGPQGSTDTRQCHVCHRIRPVTDFPSYLAMPPTLEPDTRIPCSPCLAKIHNERAGI